jgi:hypothetical protein
MAEQEQYTRGRITGGSMGSLLSPPRHPNYTHEVRFSRGIMAIEYAATDEQTAQWLHPETVAEARRLIDVWRREKPALSSDEVQAWVSAVLRHMGAERGAEYVRSYYPEYTGTVSA